MSASRRAFLVMIAVVGSCCMIGFRGFPRFKTVIEVVHPMSRYKHVISPTLVLDDEKGESLQTHRYSQVHTQTCPPLWRSYVDSYRSVSPGKQTKFTDAKGLDFNDTTSQNFTRISIFNEKPVYNLCDVLIVKIQARDWNNRWKIYGGDFFRLSIYTEVPYSEASADDIVDFNNGTYLAFFTLRWTGNVRVRIKLIHPVEMLPQMTMTLTGKVGLNITFAGEFISGEVSEEVICRYVELPEPMCNLSNPRTHGPWFCEKPKDPRLSCADWRFHKMYKGTFLKLEANLTPLSKSLLLRSHMVEIKNNCTVTVDDIEDSPVVNKNVSSISYCSINGVPQGIHASGHFFRDRWYRDGCKVVSFNLEDGMKCLRNRKIVILGDSTIRQIYEYFREVHKVYFKQLPLPDGAFKRYGPLDLVSKEYNASMQFHFHGLPSSGTNLVLRTDYIEFIADRLNSQRDGCEVVYIISLWGHFIATGKEFYIQRLLAVKQSIQAFLDRCPGSKVIIKGANTKRHPALWIAVVSSEWNILNHELALKEVFKDEKRVGFIDSFDVTRVQRFEDQIHPERPIVKGFVNQILTYLCKGR